jgi:hypothetical protein
VKAQTADLHEGCHLRLNRQPKNAGSMEIVIQLLLLAHTNVYRLDVKISCTIAMISKCA